MGTEDDLLALEVARADQENAAAVGAGVDVAKMLVAFHGELRKGQMDDQLCADLTVMYFESMLSAAEDED